MIYITRTILNQLIDWVKEEYPNEAAGYLFKDNTILKKIITRNHSAGYFYDNNPEQLLKWINEYGKPSGVFHSHPCAAIPSSMDYKYMTTTIPFWGCVWFIMSNRMRLRTWSLTELTLHIIELKVEIIE